MLSLFSELVQDIGLQASSKDQDNAASPSAAHFDMATLLLSFVAGPFGFSSNGKGVSTAAAHLTALLYQQVGAGEAGTQLLNGLMSSKPVPLSPRKFRALLEILHAQGLANDIDIDSIPGAKNSSRAAHDSTRSSRDHMRGGAGRDKTDKTVPAPTEAGVEIDLALHYRLQWSSIIKKLRAFHDKDSWKLRTSGLNDLGTLLGMRLAHCWHCNFLLAASAFNEPVVR